MSDQPASRQDASACPPAFPSAFPSEVSDRQFPDCSPPDGPGSDGQTEELALDLTREAVRLLARDASGAWTELGAVPLAADDFRTGIDALRRQAEVCGAPPVTLWLPADQIHIRRYVLKRGNRQAQALHRLAEDTGSRADELSVALSPAGDGELVTVLGTLKQTVAEAHDYARRWGFWPGRVSTRVEAARFGAEGPAFALPDPGRRPAFISARRALTAAAAILVISLGAWSAFELLPASQPPPAVVASAPELGMGPAEVRAGTPGAPAAGFGRGQSEPLGADRSMPSTRPADPDSRIGSASGAVGGADLPPELAPAMPDRPARPGLGSEASEDGPLADRSLADRPKLAGREARADIATLQAGLERIRAGGTAGQETEDPTLLATSGIAPVTVPGRPVPRPGDLEPADAAAEEKSVEAEGSDVPPPPVEMSDSRLAVEQAPRPPARPARRDHPTSLKRAAAPSASAAPPPIGKAAAGQGLALDSTSLIGVIDVNSGREALLRTSSGEFLKVARGDEVAGWRVNAIGQDAMRLTRGGESRTLLLVTR